MNDFTKVELQEIYGLLGHHYCAPEKCFNPNTKLFLKLESMIYNYCEHNGEIGKDYPAKKCMKCNRMWE